MFSFRVSYIVSMASTASFKSRLKTFGQLDVKSFTRAVRWLTTHKLPATTTTKKKTYQWHLIQLALDIPLCFHYKYTSSFWRVRRCQSTMNSMTLDTHTEIGWLIKTCEILNSTPWCLSVVDQVVASLQIAKLIV